MTLANDKHQEKLLAAGWHSRGYLPHFDGIAIPQFITIHLADSLPTEVLQTWRRELQKGGSERERIILQRRIEKYLDQGFGNAYLKDDRIATLVQNSLLRFHGIRYRLFAWVVMPNHVHTLFTRLKDYKIKKILHSLKSYTAHESNHILGRMGQFWLEDYFDRYTRNEKHFYRIVRYIENNPVKARLCSKPSDWPYSSAWFKKSDSKDFVVQEKKVASI
jgi:REP element-mobilizing transposase RayT